MFDSLIDSFKNSINKIRFSDDEKSLQKALVELKKSLLKSDVHHKTVKELLTNVEVQTRQNGIGKESFLNALKDNLNSILTANGSYGFNFDKKPPTVVLMVGLQGSGKTTTAGKLANYLKQKGKKVLLSACDLQRMAAVEQLKQIAQKIEVDIYFEDDNKDAVAIAKNSLKKAQTGLYDVLIVDSAGRLAIDEALMDELVAVKSAINPFETFYVADSLTGQDALRSATTFKEKIGLTGAILTKFDGDSKGGIALSIAHQTDIPLRFIGTGEKIPDLELFIPSRITNRLMGAGDIESLAEKTANVIDEKKAKDLTKKIKKGSFNFNDFLEQLENMKKLGSLKSIVSMIPGLGNLGNSLKDIDLDNSEEIKKIRAMISSMTKKEREEPELLNNSRKKRIAQGAGLDIVEVNKVIKQFNNASKMAKKFAGKSGMKDLMNMLSKQNIPR